MKVYEHGRQFLFGKVVLVGLLGLLLPVAAYAAAGAALPPGYQPLYRTDWQSGLDRGLMFQGPTERSFEVGAAPGDASRKALKVTILKQDDYSRVANGVPRAEVNFGPRVRFQAGREYWIAWSTYIPGEFQFDSKQPEGISQIHGGAAQGSPPWGIVLTNDRYEVQLRNGTRVETRDAGSAAGDKGKWVAWSFHYRPDAAGGRAISELSKDGVEVLNADGRPNAYPDDNMGYLKIGIYKWWWKERPSDVTERTLYFGDVLIGVK